MIDYDAWKRQGLAPDEVARLLVNAHADGALKQVRLGLAAARRARCRHRYDFLKSVESAVLASSSPIVNDPPV